MNAVEFFFALSAVTFMTTVIYFWTRFVYKLEAQEPPQRETASASRHSAREDKHYAGLEVNVSEALNDQGAVLR